MAEMRKLVWAALSNVDIHSHEEMSKSVLLRRPFDRSVNRMQERRLEPNYILFSGRKVGKILWAAENIGNNVPSYLYGFLWPSVHSSSMRFRQNLPCNPVIMGDRHFRTIAQSKVSSGSLEKSNTTGKSNAIRLQLKTAPQEIAQLFALRPSEGSLLGELLFN